MRCLNVVWMVISPRTAHAFGILMIRHDVVVVREFFMADRTLLVLLRNLPIQEFPHLGG